MAEQLTVTLPEGKWAIQLLDNNGRPAIQVIETRQRLELGVAHLPRGLYYLKMSDGKRTRVEKIVLQ